MLRRAATATPVQYSLLQLPRCFGRALAGRCASTDANGAITGGDPGDPVVVAYPGSPGSLSNIGAKQFFRGLNANFNGNFTIPATFAAVSSGQASFGVIPIENSSSGTVHMTYDLLLEHDVAIAGDLGVHEKYALCVKPGVDLSTIRTVQSHPVILDACSEFIGQKLQPGQNLIAKRTTCEAAVDLATGSSDDIACIATHEAATLHGLKVVGSDIGNDVFMETRYILIRRSSDTDLSWSMPKHLRHADVAKKRSGCFVLHNEPGALFKLLSCYALRDVNLVKVESRPLCSRTFTSSVSPLPTSVARLWDHTYYVDHVVPHGQTEEEAQQLWSVLCEFSNWQRDFGTYSSLVSRSEKKAASWDEMYQTMTWG